MSMLIPDTVSGLQSIAACHAVMEVQQILIERLSVLLDEARGCRCWRDGDMHCHCNNDD